MKRLVRILMVVLCLGGIAAFMVYQWILGVNTTHTDAQLIYIETGANFENVLNTLDTAGILMNSSSFIRVSNWMKYSENIKSGRYLIPPNLSNRELVGLLRSGNQKPVQLTFSTARTIEDIAGIAAKKLESDSLQILETIRQENVLENYNLNLQNIISVFIPNTYEVYWNISPEQLIERMYKEYEKFWQSGERSGQLEKLNLTRQEVSTIASIVEKESIQKEERPVIAGLYLNRIKKGIPLQADPTVVFGVGDFTIRRVLNKHLAHDSPYNTYMYSGIPPGPICMPSISSIDAVLNPDQHDYYFMCAKPGYNGYHAFAKNTAEHERNARVYRNWLNSEGIRG